MLGNDIEAWPRSSVMPVELAALVYAQFLTSLGQPGDVAEFGVFRGETSRAFCDALAERGSAKRVHLFDTFAGLPADGPEDGERNAVGIYKATAEEVRATLRGCRNYQLHGGLIGTYVGVFAQPLCFAFVDVDLYQGTKDALAICDRVLVPGGRIVIDDYDRGSWPGVKPAVDRWLDPTRYCCWTDHGLYFAERLSDARRSFSSR